MKSAGVYYDPITRDVIYVGRELNSGDEPQGTVWKKVNVGSFPKHDRPVHLRVNEFTERIEKKTNQEIVEIEDSIRHRKLDEKVKSDKSDLRAIIKVMAKMINKNRTELGLPKIPLDNILQAIKDELYGIPKVRNTRRRG